MSTEVGAAQHASPRQASIPSRTAKPAITSAATESAHAHPSHEFSASHPGSVADNSLRSTPCDPIDELIHPGHCLLNAGEHVESIGGFRVEGVPMLSADDPWGP